MKSSISMKSWKTTMSLSALLFLMFALTVLSWPFIGVSMPSSLSSPASPANGSISYDKGANVITVTGYNSGAPCTFTDVYNADVTGGWGKVHLQATNQFSFDSKLYIGDGSTLTTFSDTGKQIIFTDFAAAWNALIYIQNNASFTLGTVTNVTNKATANGCSLFSLGTSEPLYIGWVAAGGTMLLYSCSVSSPVSKALMLGGVDTVTDNSRIWNCNLHRTQIRGGGCKANLYNIYVSDALYEAGIFGMIGDMDALRFDDCRYAIYHYTTYNGIYSNLRNRNATTGFMALTGATGDDYIINADVDSWVFTWSTSPTVTVYRQYTFDLKVTDRDDNAMSGATVTLKDKNGNTVFSVTTNASGDIATQTVSRGYYDQAHGDTLQEHSPHTLTITKEGYQTYTGNFTLSQKANWTIALQPLTDSGLIEHVGFVPVDPGLTSPSGTYRWLDVADQAYGIGYRNSYNYSQAAVEVAYCTEGNKLRGLLKARDLKPNFAYQLKLVGTPGTADNERIGLVGRWWQEEWTGTTWANGQNLNDKGDGSSPNPNDQTYLGRRYIQDSSSPTGYHYRYTGYLVFNYFITDSNGTTTLQFETGSCYHVIWKTTQRSNATNDGPVKTATFDPAPSQPAYDTDYPSNTVSIFGEWERLPMDQVNLQPGEYNCQILLTEESFHGSGGTLAGNWAGVVTANIMFTIN